MFVSLLKRWRRGPGLVAIVKNFKPLFMPVDGFVWY